jgi:hypothetical protein
MLLWISALALLLLMSSIVVAFVDRGRRQAAAFGFATFMGIYGLLGWISDRELPTDLPLSLVYRLVVNETWIDASSQQVVSESEAFLSVGLHRISVRALGVFAAGG